MLQLYIHTPSRCYSGIVILYSVTLMLQWICSLRISLKMITMSSLLVISVRCPLNKLRLSLPPGTSYTWVEHGELV